METIPIIARNGWNERGEKNKLVDKREEQLSASTTDGMNAGMHKG